MQEGRFWHLADMMMTFSDVRFRGQSGHSEARRQCPLMTHSGHRTLRADTCPLRHPFSAVGSDANVRN